MPPLLLHELHASAKARFCDFNGQEAVADYGDSQAEHAALRQTAGILDFSFRGRLCLVGLDRQRFLHGQVTNDVNSLKIGEGCYAALVTAKGKMISDLNIYRLENELLVEFEPGLSDKVRQRLEHYIVADDVQVMDVAPEYGLLSVQGPRAGDLVQKLNLAQLPAKAMNFLSHQDANLGEIYLMNQPRLGTVGFDLFVPSAALSQVAQRLFDEGRSVDARLCGWDAFEVARIEAGIPRFGVDMDESNLPPEAGLEARAVSYSKGCYIGQEVINRIRTYGQVAKALRGLRLAHDLPALPKKGDKLFKANTVVGFITSALASKTLKSNIALGYVRREANALGTELSLRTAAGDSATTIVALPFQQNFA